MSFLSMNDIFTDKKMKFQILTYDDQTLSTNPHMQSMIGITDIDLLIISHANHPSVPTVSELNTYYYALHKDRADTFRSTRLDIGAECEKVRTAHMHPV